MFLIFTSISFVGKLELPVQENYNYVNSSFDFSYTKIIITFPGPLQCALCACGNEEQIETSS